MYFARGPCFHCVRPVADISHLILRACSFARLCIGSRRAPHICLPSPPLPILALRLLTLFHWRTPSCVWWSFCHAVTPFGLLRPGKVLFGAIVRRCVGRRDRGQRARAYPARRMIVDRIVNVIDRSLSGEVVRDLRRGRNPERSDDLRSFGCDGCSRPAARKASRADTRQRQSLADPPFTSIRATLLVLSHGLSHGECASTSRAEAIPYDGAR